MLKKHLKKIVSLVLVTMMAIGMSITAIAAEPYQNELEAVMDTSPADSGQVTHYDTTTGEMLVEDGELLTFDEVAIPVPKGSADTPSERGIEIYLVRAGIKKTSGGEFTWYFNVDCPTSPFVKPNIKLTAQLKGSFTTLSGSYSNVGGSVYHTYTSNSEYGVDYTWTVPAKTGYYYVAYTITDYDNATSGSGVTTTALSNRTGHAWNFNFSDSVSGKSLPMPPANYAKGATTTRPSNLADTYYNTYLYLYFTAVLRSFGNSMFQAVAMLVSTILNAVFDPVFIHFIGFHGAAIATLLSQMICLLFMLTYLKKKKLFTFKISAFNCSDVLLLIQKAIPSVIQQSIPAISTTSLTALVSTYSVTAIAAYGVTGKLETILFYPAMALNMVLTTIIGQCAGGARYDRAKDYLKCALGYGCGLLVILSVLVVGFSKQLSGLFVRSSDVAVIVGTYFLIVSIGYVLNTVTNCYLGALNGMGKPSISMFLMIFYYIVVRMPLAYLLSYLGFGLNGIWVAVLVSHIVASLAATMTGTVLIRKKGNIKA